MKLYSHQVVNVAKALAALDGFETVIQENGKDRVVKYPYRFNADATWNWVGVNAVLKPAAAKIEDARMRLARQFCPAGVNVVPPDKMEEYIKQYSVILEKEEVYKIKPMKRADLNVYDEKLNSTGNLIPISVIEGLLPILS